MTKNKENMNNPVDEQEVRNLISQIQSGNTDAEVQLVDLYKRYTVSMIRIHKENGYTLTDEEIASACKSALKRAARKFDLNKDFDFISYAIWWMKEGVLQAQKAERMEKINQIFT